MGTPVDFKHIYSLQAAQFVYTAHWIAMRSRFVSRLCGRVNFDAFF
jgi:hypothetical protein